MNARPGDELLIHSRQIGQPDRVATIVDVRDAGGREYYRVRWPDGRETIVFPGSDATVRSSGQAGPAGRETRSVAIELRLEEDTKRCEATATMHTAQGTFTGRGLALRHPDDPLVPMIGEELAIARSLAHLAEQLERAASRAIAAGESKPLHLV